MIPATLERCQTRRTPTSRRLLMPYEMETNITTGFWYVRAWIFLYELLDQACLQSFLPGQRLCENFRAIFLAWINWPVFFWPEKVGLDYRPDFWLPKKANFRPLTAEFRRVGSAMKRHLQMSCLITPRSIFISLPLSPVFFLSNPPRSVPYYLFLPLSPLSISLSLDHST